MSQKGQHGQLCNSFEELQRQVKRQCVQFSTPQNEIRYVSDQLKMITPYDSTILTTQQRKEAVMQARQILQEKECVKICEAANLYLQLVVCVVRAH